VLSLVPQKLDALLRVSNRENKALAEAIAERDPERARASAIAHATGSRDLLVAFVQTRD
jgi:DNA-binding GntR family transcriptional regulator